MDVLTGPENQIAIRFAGTGQYPLTAGQTRGFEALPFEMFLCAERGTFSMTADGKTAVCREGDAILVPCDTAFMLGTDEEVTVFSVAADCRIYETLRVLSLYDLPTVLAGEAQACRRIRKTALESEFTNTRLECAMTIDHALYGLFCEVIADGVPLTNGTMRLERYARLAAVLSHIGANIDRNFKLDELSSLVELSEDSFYRLFKSTLGEAPKEYLISERMRLARFLLVSTSLSVAEITKRIGYENPFYFSTLFHQRNGMPPSEYREKTAGLFC